MFMHDRWEELANSPDCDLHTLKAARELAGEMCKKIFDSVGLTTDTDEKYLKALGRGLVYMFLLRSEPKPKSKVAYKRARKVKQVPVLETLE